MRTTKTYLKIYYPGIFSSENTSQLVNDRNPERDVKTLSKRCYVFRYFDIIEDESDGILLKSEEINLSKFYFINAKISSAENILERYSSNSIIVSNIKCNKYTHIVETRHGNVFACDKNDIIINI